jgi:hypothetical protein
MISTQRILVLASLNSLLAASTIAHIQTIVGTRKMKQINKIPIPLATMLLKINCLWQSKPFMLPHKVVFNDSLYNDFVLNRIVYKRLVKSCNEKQPQSPFVVYGFKGA